MEISGRKISYNGKMEYIFDVINTDPSWVNLHRDELEPSELAFLEIVLTPAPTTDIQVNPDDFKDILDCIINEPIIQEPRIKKVIELMYADINEYNENLKHGSFSNLSIFHTNNGKPYPYIHHVDNFGEALQEKIYALSYMYRHGKLSEELFRSCEKVRICAPDIKKKIKELLTKYGEALNQFFTEQGNFIKLRRERNETYFLFRETYHYRGNMGFGKYYHRSVSYVIKNDINYIKWALKNIQDFTLKGDDLEEFIEKAGYDPYANPDKNNSFPSNDTLSDLSSILGNNDCELDSIVFKISNLPDTKVLVSLTEKYPCLKYNLYSKENQYYISFSGTFEDSTMNKEIEKISEESESSSEIIVKELLY